MTLLVSLSDCVGKIFKSESSGLFWATSKKGVRKKMIKMESLEIFTGVVN